MSVRLGAPERTLLDYALAPPEDRSVSDFMFTHASGARVLLGSQRAVNPDWPVTPALVRELLRELDKKKLADVLDPERKAAMISNLLVVLVGDREVTPGINTGTLYS